MKVFICDWGVNGCGIVVAESRDAAINYFLRKGFCNVGHLEGNTRELSLEDGSMYFHFDD